MSLTAEIALRRGGSSLALSLEAARGETIALVGPNGAGKSSCLHALAGLLPIERGRIALDGEAWDEGPGGRFVPPEERRVGLLFQEPLLFPRMSVQDNVAFGPRSRGATRREARALAERWLERVGLAGFAARRPATLSGGEAQRAALARALATEPRVLLLDEPLAAVDASGRLALRRELRAQLAGFAGVRLVVVHDIADALALAERIYVLEAGRIVQSGTIGDIVSRPRSRFVADLVGLNCFHGRARGGAVELEGGALFVASGEEGEVLVTFHPRAVSLFRERPAGSPRNVWRAPIVGLEAQLDRVRVQLGGAQPVVAEVTPAAVAELRLADGGDVWVAVKATEVSVTGT